MVAAEVSDRGSRFVFPEQADDLLLAVAARAHESLPSSDEGLSLSLVQFPAGQIVKP
jgi:hypothetical protein